MNKQLDKNKISIVIPVYNAARYIRQTLDSIRAQTYSDWELILVEDGSWDESPAICDEYGEKDSRIRVFHKENGGAAAARNYGIARTTGEYLAFVDADDLVEPVFLEKMIREYDENPEIDLVLTGYDRFYHDDLNDKKEYLLGTNEREILNSKQEVALLFTVPKTSLSGVSVWAKLYRNWIVRENQIRFPEHISYEEDCCFNLQYYRHIRKAATIRTNLLHYRQQQESLSKMYRSSMYSDLVNGYRERVRFFKEIGMKSTELCKLDTILLVVICNNYKKIATSNMKASERRQEYRKMLAFEETQKVIHSCGLSKYPLTRGLTVASRKNNVWKIDLLLWIWRKKGCV